MFCTRALPTCAAATKTSQLNREITKRQLNFRNRRQTTTDARRQQNAPRRNNPKATPREERPHGRKRGGQGSSTRIPSQNPKSNKTARVYPYFWKYQRPERTQDRPAPWLAKIARGGGSCGSPIEGLANVVCRNRGGSLVTKGWFISDICDFSLGIVIGCH